MVWVCLGDSEIWKYSDSQIPIYHADFLMFFFLPASSQLLIILLEIQPCVVSSKSQGTFCVSLSNQRFQSKIFHLPTPILSEQKKQLQKLNLFYCNYKNVIAYVKYTDAICLYQRTNIYELPVEKLKPSSTFHQYKRCLLLSRRVFLKDSHKVWRSRWEECNKNTSVSIMYINTYTQTFQSVSNSSWRVSIHHP